MKLAWPGEKCASDAGWAEEEEEVKRSLSQRAAAE